ncbi:MAG: MFS transporter [Nocardioides sp.]|uniref:MFS transporter n=1 Tax=Nocardioides sp. TaxID=35761 RepID=UPI0039E5E06D
MRDSLKGPQDPAPHDAVPSTTLGSGRANVVLLVVGLGALAVSLAQSVLVPVMATLPADLDTSATNVAWLLTSTLLVAAVSVPIMGRLGDMYGKRLMLLVAIGSLIVGSLLTAVTDDIVLLIAGRAIQGASAAAIPLGISLLSTTMPKERVGSSMALVSAMLGVGGALGLPLAGFVAEHTDFHALFWINAALGAVAFAGIAALVPESSQRAGGRIDLVGSFLLGAGLVCLLLPLSQGSDWGWSDPLTLGMIAGSVVIFAVFGWAQTRIRDSLVDLKTLASRPIMLVNLASICFGFALFASFIGTASYVEAPEASGYGFGSSLLVGGLVLLPSGVAMLLLAPLAARLIASWGAPRTLALGAVVIAVGWAGRIVLTDSLWEVTLFTTVVGAGTGIGYAAIPAMINTFVRSSEVAAANGLNTLFRSLGSSLASAVGGSILAGSSVLVSGISMPSLDAYRVLFAVCAAAAVAAALLVLLVPRTSPTGTPSPISA